MTTRVTKTQSRVLAQLRERGRYSAESFFGRGPQGGNVSGGQRELGAVLGLVRQGLAVETHRYTTSHTRGGYTVHITSVTVAPVEKETH